ncbi:MAG: 50S ribosomal protein L23 [Alphaproteobacteria bacterium]|nr:50S ribosomal protein L23 [Alphaproteobacteria bacterium]
MLNYDKIQGLVYTEKSNKQLADGKYHFRVCATCDKNEVASLIKKAFGVEVENVNIINTAGKTKRFKGTEGTRGAYKKAIVTLKEGQSINFGS